MPDVKPQERCDRGEDSIDCDRNEKGNVTVVVRCALLRIGSRRDYGESQVSQQVSIVA